MGGQQHIVWLVRVPEKSDQPKLVASRLRVLLMVDLIFKFCLFKTVWRVLEAIVIENEY
jgi:hypothetical protein